MSDDKHVHSFDFFSRTIEECGDMHYYCECGQREPCASGAGAP